jgi:uncharacterized membrane protein YeaQ/YmgE (transglycosylase-associated protein family)
MGFAILVILAIVGFVVLLPLAESAVGVAIMLLAWAGIGWVAGQVLRGRGYGAVGNILLGLGGGLVGRVLFGVIAPGLASGLLGGLLSGVVGAIVLVYIVRLLGINPSFGR